MTKLKMKMTALGIALVGAASVYADSGNDGSGVIIGIDAGRAQARKYCDGIADCDDSDTSIRGDIGYQFNKNWGIELGYTSFGTIFRSHDNNFHRQARC